MESTAGSEQPCGTPGILGEQGGRLGGWGSWEGAQQVEEKWGQLEGLKHFHFSDFSEK